MADDDKLVDVMARALYEAQSGPLNSWLSAKAGKRNWWLQLTNIGLTALTAAGYTLILTEPTAAQIEAMARAYCFAGGCYCCADATDCEAWADFDGRVRAAHAVLMKASDTTKPERLNPGSGATA